MNVWMRWQSWVSALLRLGGEIRKACLLMKDVGGPEGTVSEVGLPKTERCQEKIKFGSPSSLSKPDVRGLVHCVCRWANYRTSSNFLNVCLFSLRMATGSLKKHRFLTGISPQRNPGQSCLLTRRAVPFQLPFVIKLKILSIKLTLGKTQL